MEYIKSPIGRIPKIGLGTFSVPEEKLREVIPVALNLGCCLIDTAYKYQNEECIGEILSASGVDRHGYFIETKAHAELLLGNLRYLRLNRKSPETVRNCAAKRLRTDFIDIFMLHSPFEGYEKYIRKFRGG